MSKAAATADANGAARRPPPPAAAPAKTAVSPRDARQARFAQSFSQIVAVLMRDPSYRKLQLADLEWLVLPPVMAGQFRLAQAPMQPAGALAQPAGAKAQEGGTLVPVAVALWARVSAHIDKQMSENLDKQVRLHPADWASGDNIWLIAVAGNPRAVPKFLEQLADKEFNGKPVKMRMRTPEGNVVVKTLSERTRGSTRGVGEHEEVMKNVPDR